MTTSSPSSASSVLDLLDYIADTLEAVETRLVRVETRLCKLSEALGVQTSTSPVRPSRPARPTSL